MCGKTLGHDKDGQRPALRAQGSGNAEERFAVKPDHSAAGHRPVDRTRSGFGVIAGRVVVEARFVEPLQEQSVRVGTQSGRVTRIEPEPQARGGRLGAGGGKGGGQAYPTGGGEFYDELRVYKWTLGGSGITSKCCGAETPSVI